MKNLFFLVSFMIINSTVNGQLKKKDKLSLDGCLTRCAIFDSPYDILFPDQTWQNCFTDCICEECEKGAFDDEFCGFWCAFLGGKRNLYLFPDVSKSLYSSKQNIDTKKFERLKFTLNPSSDITNIFPKANIINQKFKTIRGEEIIPTDFPELNNLLPDNQTLSFFNTTKRIEPLSIRLGLKKNKSKMEMGFEFSYSKHKGFYESHEHLNFEIRKLSITVNPIFHWVNKNKIKLYSYIGAGAAQVEIKCTEEEFQHKKWQLIFHASPLGFRIGNTFGFSVETGIGFKGYINTGVFVKL